MATGCNVAEKHERSLTLFVLIAVYATVALARMWSMDMAPVVPPTPPGE
jgi:hypothetical protein